MALLLFFYFSRFTRTDGSDLRRSARCPDEIRRNLGNRTRRVGPIDPAESYLPGCADVQSRGRKVGASKKSAPGNSQIRPDDAAPRRNPHQRRP